MVRAKVDANAACPWRGPVFWDRQSGQAKQTTDGCPVAIGIPARGYGIADCRTEILMR
jgi:hypothetical protein